MLPEDENIIDGIKPNKLSEKYTVEDNQFTESQKNIFNDSAIFYKSAHSIVVHNDTDETYYKVEISDDEYYNFSKRYIDFIDIVGNKPPFAKFKGYSRDEDKFSIYFQCDPKKTLQNILYGDYDEEILDDTVKSKTIFAVAAALEYCHTMGVSCRFIHPESVFYDDKNDPLITGFGYSKSVLIAPNKSFNLKMTNLENPIFKDIGGYIAPELLIDPDALAYQSDIYSFGTLLYSIITNQILFKSKTKEEMLNLIQNNEFPQIEKGLCSDILVKIINNCHLENPYQRYTSSEILEMVIKYRKNLFPKCDMDVYKNYKEKILNDIYYISPEKIKKKEEDYHLTFAISSRLLNKALNQEVITKKEKKDICTILRKAARKGFAPAIYQYSLMLDSNIESFLNIDLHPAFLKPLCWMKKAAEFGVYDAPLKLGEMYHRQGLHEDADKVYNEFKKYNEICQIKCLISPTQPIPQNEVDEIINRIKRSPNPEAALEAQIFDSLKLIKKNNITPENKNLFHKKMDSLSKKARNGKPLYYSAIFYRDGEINVLIQKGIDGFLSIPSYEIDHNDSDEIDWGCSFIGHENDKIIEISKSKDLYELMLEKSADLLYEPAVAEYSVLLFNKYKSLLMIKKDANNEAESLLSKGKKLIERFFTVMKCRSDSSRPRIQHAYAMLCEIEGKKQNNPELVKKALKIYKETADNEYILGIKDYLRLYDESDEKIEAIKKYYTLKLTNYSP